MPPSGDAVGAAVTMDRLYPDLTQFYFNEGLEFGPQGDQQIAPTSPYHTLLRPDYPLYPDLTELNITEEEVQEIAPDYPTDNTNEDTEVMSRITPDYSVGGTMKGTGITNVTMNGTRYTENTRRGIRYNDGIQKGTRYTVRVNLNKLEKKILNDKTFEFLPASISPREQMEFQSWMKWRTQVNRQLVAMILIKHGKRVLMRPSELERKPLSTSTIRSVIDTAHSNEKHWTTALPGKPYIMYGIPRVQLSGQQVCM